MRGALRRLNAIEGRIRTLLQPRRCSRSRPQARGADRRGSSFCTKIYFDALGVPAAIHPPGLTSRGYRARFRQHRAWKPSSPRWRRHRRGGSAGPPWFGPESAWQTDQSVVGGSCVPWRMARQSWRWTCMTCLSHRFWHEGRGVCRCRDGESPLGADRRALSACASRRRGGRRAVHASGSPTRSELLISADRCAPTWKAIRRLWTCA